MKRRKNKKNVKALQKPKSKPEVKEIKKLPEVIEDELDVSMEDEEPQDLPVTQVEVEEFEDGKEDGYCFGTYLVTDGQCKKCLLNEDCSEETNERKRKAKKTK